MKSIQRNLWIGLAGLAFLLVLILVYAQINASQNFDLSSPARVESMNP